MIKIIFSFSAWAALLLLCFNLFDIAYFEDSAGPWVYLVLLLVYSVFSAFFSSSETAFTLAQNDYENIEIFEKKINAAKLSNNVERKLLKILDDDEGFKRFLSLVLVCNNVVNLVGMALLAKIISSDGDSFNTLISTLAVLVFGEILAKSYATAKPYKVLGLVTWIIYYLWKYLGLPLHAMVSPIVNKVTKIQSVDN